MEYIENEFLKIGVDKSGAQLSSVYDKKKGREVLWNADKNYWGRHAPVLFPIVGKVRNNTYTYQGKQYTLGQHGFARDLDFTLVSKSADEIVFSLKSTPDTLKVYPFDFELIISHNLEGNKVRVSWKVVNTGADTMYFSIGGHPAFNVPALGTGDSKEDYYLHFEGKSSVAYKLLDPSEGTVDNSTVKTLDTENGFFKIKESMFDNDALIFDEYEVEKVSLCYSSRKPYITLEARGFPSFGIWSATKKNAPFVCLEPWIGRADDKGFEGSLDQKYKEQKLSAGQTFKADYTIEVN